MSSKTDGKSRFFLMSVTFMLASAMFIGTAFAEDGVAGDIIPEDNMTVSDEIAIDEGSDIAPEEESYSEPEVVTDDIFEESAVSEESYAIEDKRERLKDVKINNPISEDSVLPDVYILRLESSMRVKGPAISSVTNSKDLQTAMSERGIVTTETMPSINSIVVYSTDADSLADLPGVLSVEPMRIYRALLDVSVPQINADDVWGLGYNGTGVDVCIIDTGVDKWHTNIKTATSTADFTAHDWCVDLGLGYIISAGGPWYGDSGEFESSSGVSRKFNQSVNISNASLNWLEIGITSYYNGNYSNTGQRYDITVSFPNGTKINDTSGLALSSYREDAADNRWYVINVSLGGTTGLYTVEINETNITTTGDYPLVIWGSNVTYLYDNYYSGWYDCDTYDAAYSAWNPAESGEPLAFNNIVANDDHSHGSHVAGTIVSDNATYEGVAPGANIYVAKALNSYGSGMTSGIINAINWCRSHGVDVISMSLGGTASLGCSDSQAVLVDTMTSYDIMPVIAAGNSGPGAMTIGSPGCARNALTIGAVGSTDTIASFSSRGPTNDTTTRTKPDVAAPGVSIYSSIPTNRWVDMSGTSMSTPHVAGVAALLKQKNPTWISQQLKTALMNAVNQSVVGLGSHDNSYGFGRVDALEAVNSTWTTTLNITNNTVDSNFKINHLATKDLRVTIYWEENTTDSHNKIYLNITNSTGAILDSSSDNNNTAQQVAVSSADADTYYLKIIGNNVTGTKTLWIAANSEIDDAGAPVITIAAPSNTTYGKSILFNVTLDEAADWCGFSLNGAANISMGTASSTAWNYTNSSMASGVYTVVFYCNDTSNNMANTTARVFSVDATAPAVTIAAPSNTTYGKSILFNVSSSEAASTCKYSLNGAANTTMTNSSTTRWTNTNSSMASGAYNAVFYCIDNYDNTGTNTTYFSVDASGPAITVNTPDNITYGSNITFDVTTSENAAACEYSLDGAANVSMTNSSMTGWSYLKTGIADAAYNIKFYCTDMYSNTNVSDTAYFTVNSDFSVDITTPANTSYGSTSVNITAVTNLDSDFCFMALDGANNTMVNSSTTRWYNNTTTGLSNGGHNMYVWCNNSAGTLSAFDQVYFTVDTTAPTVTIVIPANTTYGMAMTYNATVNEAASSCKYSLDGAANISMSNISTTSWYKTNSSMAHGAHNAKFYCSDIVGNEGNSTTEYFSVDAYAPSVVIVLPANTTYNSAAVPFNVTSSEAAPSCSYSLNDAANVTMGNTSTTSWNATATAAEGPNSVIFYCTDAYSNTGTNTTYFTIDTTAATISGVLSYSVTNSSATINATTSENASCLVQYGFNTSYASSSTVTANSTSHTKSLTSLSQGTLYHYRLNCTDLYGNRGVGSDNTFLTGESIGQSFDNTTVESLTFETIEDNETLTAAEINVSTNETVDASVTVIKSYENAFDDNLTVEALEVYYNITSEGLDASNLEWVYMKLYYEDADLPADINESTLRIYLYNETSVAWEVMSPGGVDTTNDYVWANTTHFSYYSIGGELNNEAEEEEEDNDQSYSATGATTYGEYEWTGASMSRALGVYESVKFTLDGQAHTIKVLSLSAASATLRIGSQAFVLAINVGETKEVDVDGDGVSDVSIALSGIAGGKGSFEFSMLEAEPEAGEEVTQPETQPETQPDVTVQELPTTSMVIVLAIVFVLAVAYMKFSAKKKRK